MTETDYAVAPGEYLDEWIEEHALGRHQIIASVGQSGYHRAQIIRLGGRVLPESATFLARLTGIPVAAWLRMEEAYRADLKRLGIEAETQATVLTDVLAGAFAEHRRDSPHRADCSCGAIVTRSETRSFLMSVGLQSDYEAHLAEQSAKWVRAALNGSDT